MNTKLNDSNSIPRIGLGTWQLEEEATCREAVKSALDAGYRHIDTASVYKNEEYVGRAIADHDVPREEIFLTSKVWNDDQGFEQTIQACKDSLERLRTDYLDLYLVHWPVSETRTETYRALEQLQKDGLVKSIGVSNFLVDQLQDLLDKTDVVPAVNQIEMHPFNYKQREDVASFCADQNIAIEAYSPLVQGKKFDEPVIRQIAEAHNVSSAQALIAWSLHKGFIVIPRSSSKDHIVDNYGATEVTLSGEEIDNLDSLNEDLITTMDPAKF